MINKDEVLARAVKYNSKDGRTLKSLNTVFNTSYPVGTNLVVEYIKLMVGTPYGDNGYCSDKKMDCSQFVINTLYYWFGINYLGSYTESIYRAASEKGKKYLTIGEAPILSIVEWKLSDRNPHATHTGLKFSNTEIADTRSLVHPLMIRLFKGWYENRITLIADILTEEQRKSVIVQEVVKPIPVPIPVITPKKYIYKGASYTNFRNKPSVAGKIIGKIKTNDVVEYINKTGIWWNVKFNGVVGYCTNTKLFKVTV